MHPKSQMNFVAASVAESGENKSNAGLSGSRLRLVSVAERDENIRAALKTDSSGIESYLFNSK